MHAQAPVLGTGAGSYGTLRLRYRLDARQVRHAHGYVVQTLADLGWVGLGLSLLAAFTWLGTVARYARDPPARPRAAVGRRARRPRLAGRGGDRVRAALRDRLDLVRARQRAAGAAVRGLRGLARDAARAAVGRLRRGRRARGDAPAWRAWRRSCSCSALIAAWSALQPVRAAHAQDAARERVDRGELEGGGVDRADRARPQPAVGRSAVRAGGDRAGGGPQRPRAHAARAGDRPRAGEPGVLAPAGPAAAERLSTTRRAR